MPDLPFTTSQKLSKFFATNTGSTIWSFFKWFSVYFWLDRTFSCIKKNHFNVFTSLFCLQPVLTHSFIMQKARFKKKPKNKINWFSKNDTFYKCFPLQYFFTISLWFKFIIDWFPLCKLIFLNQQNYSIKCLNT